MRSPVPQMIAARRKPLAHWLAVALTVAAAHGEGSEPPQYDYQLSDRTDTPFRVPTAPSVFNCADSGAGSLRAAVASATSGDTIDLTQLNCSTISLTTGAISIGVDNLTLNGPGSSLLTVTRSSANAFRIFSHTATGGILQLRGLTVAFGLSASGSGGCISSLASVVLDHTIVKNCHAITLPGDNSTGQGGGIYTQANLTALGSSIQDNNIYTIGASARGGGAFVRGDLLLRNSSINDNIVQCPVARSYGGGLFAAGNVDISGSTIAHNNAGVTSASGVYDTDGSVGGISIVNRSASAVITNSTISGNSASHAIGGIFSVAPLQLRNSTVAFNTSNPRTIITYNPAAGVYVYTTSANLQSSIISNNTVNSNLFDLSSYLGTIAGANNLITASTVSPAGTLTADPQLYSLGFNGGPTLTHALAPTSAAIDKGNNAGGLTNDQRGPGFTRKFNGRSDIGAFESGDGIFIDGFQPPS